MGVATYGNASCHDGKKKINNKHLNQSNEIQCIS